MGTLLDEIVVFSNHAGQTLAAIQEQEFERVKHQDYSSQCSFSSDQPRFRGRYFGRSLSRGFVLPAECRAYAFASSTRTSQRYPSAR